MSPFLPSPAPPAPDPPLDPDDDAWARAMVRHAQDVLTAVDAEGRILYDSPSVLRVLGYAQGELVGRSAFELIHPDDLPTALRLLVDAANAPGGVSSLIYRFRHREGGWRFLESVGTAVSGSNGIALIVTSRDVTQQVRSVDVIRSTLQALEARVDGGTAEVEALQLEMLQRLARAAELRDDETGRHTRRVADLAGRIAEALGLCRQEVQAIRNAAPLHDVGKIGVSDEILRKRGALTEEEMQVMRTHTVLGARILSGGSSDLLRTAEQIALHHHERWDGTGYPHGLRGVEIPIAARVVAVADFFDALTHDRPYRAAVPPADVVRAVAEGIGSHFDPDAAKAFLALRASPAAAPARRPETCSSTGRSDGGERLSFTRYDQPRRQTSHPPRRREPPL